MKKPTLEEVTEYCLERSSTVDPQVFLDHYEMLGWTWGRHNKPIKSWQACVRTWENLDKKRVAERGGDIISRVTDRGWADEAVIVENRLLKRN